MIAVLVDGKCVARVPLWLSRHVIDDAVSRFPGRRDISVNSG